MDDPIFSITGPLTLFRVGIIGDDERERIVLHKRGGSSDSVAIRNDRATSLIHGDRL